MFTWSFGRPVYAFFLEKFPMLFACMVVIAYETLGKVLETVFIQDFDALATVDDSDVVANLLVVEDKTKCDILQISFEYYSAERFLLSIESGLYRSDFV